MNLKYCQNNQNWGGVLFLWVMLIKPKVCTNRINLLIQFSVYFIISEYLNQFEFYVLNIFYES